MYIAKIKKFPFDKKYKCKGHFFIKGTQTLVLILDNEERIMIPTNKYIIKFDDGWFKMELKNVKKDSQGKAVVNHDLKE